MIPEVIARYDQVKPMLNDNILNEFIHGFYGYGTYQARFWFVGMEEGGGHTLDEIAKRIGAWDARGRSELEDVAEYHRAIGIHNLFDDLPKLQPTWNKIIRIVLAAADQTVDLDRIREYQKSALGRPNGETCLLELLPLPSRNTQTWLYRDNSSHPYLTNREEYREHVAPLRITHLQDRLASYHPKAVVFYGQEYRLYWSQIARVRDWVTSPDGIVFGLREGTIFVLAKHPAARGVTNEYFHQIGKLMASRMLA